MIHGERKEYVLTVAEIAAFVSWYNDRAAGTGLPYYIFSKQFNLGPFLSRKDYLVHNKIQDFEIMGFAKTA